MITTNASDTDIAAWFAGRLPDAWTGSAPDITVDREEILVTVHVAAPALDGDAADSAAAEAAAGRISAWREETREPRMAIAREAQRRFGRTVSWGASVAGSTALFTHLAVPVMTRLRQRERLVLDTLIEGGVARSRADALQWCVKLVGTNSEEWLGNLRSAMEQVRSVREQGPAA